MKARDFSNIFTGIILFIVLVTIFPLAAQKIFNGILTGIIIAIIASLIIFIVWWQLQRRL